MGGQLQRRAADLRSRVADALTRHSERLHADGVSRRHHSRQPVRFPGKKGTQTLVCVLHPRQRNAAGCFVSFNDPI